MENKGLEMMGRQHAFGFSLKIDRHLLGLFIVLGVIIIAMSFFSEKFLTHTNLFNVLQQASFVMILAFGMTFVLSTGGIDLSVGSICGICGGMAAWLLKQDVHVVIAVATALILGAFIGAVNGLTITKLNISPFMATLAMMIILRGILYVWTGAIPFRSYMTNGFQFLGSGRIFGVQFPVIIAIVLLIALLIVYRKMKFGRHILALGSSEEAVRISGIKVDRLRIKVYALSGLTASIAGVLLASRLTTVNPEMGKGYELEAIAAAIIGGTALAGGKGTLIGTALGAIILFMIKNAMNLNNVNPYWETIVIGFIILLAVSVPILAGYFKDKVKAERG
ncbi:MULTISPECIES: ABC transporter permease [unclassified Paenibacillus]|uniref:ABC transporter permease n=1 Tax=unclassified Paenibacillus TaxID=185978 RepID=UPI0006D2748E|nr:MULTISPECIES: ABC transporter permease [unclassified Paenibacillus]